MIVFTTQEKVDEQHADRCTRDDHDRVGEEEKTEHVVHFAEPHVVHDEEEFDKDGAEWEYTDEEHRGEGPKVGCAGRYLAGNLVDADRRCDRLSYVNCAFPHDRSCQGM